MSPKKQDINLTRKQEEDTFQIETSVPNNHPITNVPGKSNKVLLLPWTEEIKYYCECITKTNSKYF